LGKERREGKVEGVRGGKDQEKDFRWKNKSDEEGNQALGAKTENGPTWGWENFKKSDAGEEEMRRQKGNLSRSVLQLEGQVEEAIRTKPRGKCLDSCGRVSEGGRGNGEREKKT